MVKNSHNKALQCTDHQKENTPCFYKNLDGYHQHHFTREARTLDNFSLVAPSCTTHLYHFLLCGVKWLCGCVNECISDFCGVLFLTIKLCCCFESNLANYITKSKICRSTCWTGVEVYQVNMLGCCHLSFLRQHSKSVRAAMCGLWFYFFIDLLGTTWFICYVSKQNYATRDPSVHPSIHPTTG